MCLSLIGDGCGRVQVYLTVAGASPGLVVLGARRNQVEKSMRSKPVNSTPSFLLLLLLPPASCPRVLCDGLISYMVK